MDVRETQWSDRILDSQTPQTEKEQKIKKMKNSLKKD